MLEEMVLKGKLKVVAYDTYVRGSNESELTMVKEKSPLSNIRDISTK
ncbi:MAG TPA: hypothetical protein VH500_05925 [Nitrososphaeraceae archaeon]|jgi:hypothetical protein